MLPRLTSLAVYTRFSYPTRTRFLSSLVQRPVVRYPYYIPRNTRGSLPVYTDVRNAGTRYLVLIRNIQGDSSALAKDLSESLFERGSEESSRLRIDINRSKNLVIQGGRWKNRIMEWLSQKGF